MARSVEIVHQDNHHHHYHLPSYVFIDDDDSCGRKGTAEFNQICRLHKQQQHKVVANKNTNHLEYRYTITNTSTDEITNRDIQLQIQLTFLKP